MARLARLNIAGVPQHIIQRGNNRQATFFSDDDYAVYLDRLREYAEKFEVDLHAFVLMTNHVHLLATPREPGAVSQMMQSLGRYYVRYINQTCRRSGTLWEGRYRSALVDADGYFLTVSRYIELNPVRADMVSHPREYTWSSYRHNALGTEIKFITPHSCYTALGRNTAQRCQAYRTLFKARISAPAMEAIRTNTNKGWALGSERFRQEIEEMAGRRAAPKPRGGDRKSKNYKEGTGDEQINLL